MVRPRTASLTEHELAIMRILWKEAPLSVHEILDALPKDPKPAYTSLLTGVRAMETKGFVSREKVGKAHVYSPKLEEPKYKRSALKRLVTGVFGGNAFDAAVNIIKEEKLSKKEIRALKAMLEDL